MLLIMRCLHNYTIIIQNKKKRPFLTASIYYTGLPVFILPSFLGCRRCALRGGGNRTTAIRNLVQISTKIRIE